MNRELPVDKPSLEASSLQPSLNLANPYLICSTCIRTFRTLQSVLSHVRDVHQRAPSSSLSMWTEPLSVAYEDPVLVVVVKPQGMAVMGASPSLCRSELLLPFQGEGPEYLTKPIPVHRLDAPTGGLLVVAKTKTAEIQLKKAFAEHQVQKRYRAIVVGKLEPSEGECKIPVGGKEAHTKYKICKYVRTIAVQSKDGWMTVVDLHPVTGRRHQLRKHMKAIGHPIWGDSRYGTFAASSMDDDTVYSRLCLWAIEIELPHPTSGALTRVIMEDPEWLKYVISQQENAWKQKTESSL